MKSMVRRHLRTVKCDGVNGQEKNRQVSVGENSLSDCCMSRIFVSISASKERFIGVKGNFCQPVNSNQNIQQ
jgi:hypothetical protein